MRSGERSELWRALAALVGPPSRERRRLAEALELGSPPGPEEYTEVFLLQLPPFASVYLGAEGMLGGEARDRVAGFWRAVGRRPPAEPDHLGLLLALYASLLDEGEGAESTGAGTDRPLDPAHPKGSEAGGTAVERRLARHARKTLFYEHLACWLPPYLLSIQEVAEPFYHRWAELLMEVLVREGEELGGNGELAVHLAEAPELEEDPPRVEPSDMSSGSGKVGSTKAEAGGGHPKATDLASQVLTPVRSGLILTRADLVRGARGRELPLRIGERRFALRQMLAAEPFATLEWLEEEARRWIRLHQSWALVARGAGGFWQARAHRAEEVIRELRAS